MKEIIKYLSDDGLEFKVKAECMTHEANVLIMNDIISELPVRPDGCGFSTGDGYVQHDRELFDRVKIALLEFYKRYTTHKWIQETIDDPLNIDPSWAGRILGETAPNIIYKSWYRFMCTGKNLKEFGQPYYATHQIEAKNICLN